MMAINSDIVSVDKLVNLNIKQHRSVSLSGFLSVDVFLFLHPPPPSTPSSCQVILSDICHQVGRWLL